MPLKPGYSKRTVRENTQREIQAGKSPEQASAIAHSVARKAKRNERRKQRAKHKPRK